MPEIEKYHYMMHKITGFDSGFIHSNNYLSNIIGKFIENKDNFILILTKEGYEHTIKKKESKE